MVTIIEEVEKFDDDEPKALKVVFDVTMMILGFHPRVKLINR